MQSNIESSAAEVIPCLKALLFHISIFHSSFLVALMVFSMLGQATSAKETKENMTITEAIHSPLTNGPVINVSWPGQLPSKTQPHCHRQWNTFVAGNLT